MKQAVCWMTWVGVVCVAVAQGRADYAGEVTADGPVAYYRFTERAGSTIIRDSSGNGHRSLVVSNVVFRAAGRVGWAAQFSNAYVRVDPLLDPSAGDFSVETLVWFDVAGRRHTIVDQRNGNGTGEALLIRTADNKLNSDVGESMVFSGYPTDEHKWYHVVLTVEEGGSNDTVRLYVDGEERERRTVTVGTADGDWVLGAGKSFFTGLVGRLDEVVVYDKALDPARVLAHWQASTPMHYVATNGGSVYPYANWDDAASNIQDAVDAALAGDTVRVGDGTYYLTSPITVSKAITVESVNGANVTTVDGQNAHRCFELDDHACTIRGFTITNGLASGGYHPGNCGGGVYCSDTTPVIADCVLSGNSASAFGGGSWYGTLNNCTLSGNEAYRGGGSCVGTLNNCTLSGNSSSFRGGGSDGSTLNNCTLSNNSSTNGGGSYNGTQNRCTIYYN